MNETKEKIKQLIADIWAIMSQNPDHDVNIFVIYNRLLDIIEQINRIEPYKKKHPEMNDYDYHTLKRILLTNPHYICVGLITKALMESLIILQLSGIIKHILFYDCDPVECYIEIEWSKTK